MVWGRIKYAAALHGAFDFVLFCLHYALKGEGSAFDDLRVVICAASGLLVICVGLLCYIAISARGERGAEGVEAVPLMELGRKGREVGGDLVMIEEDEGREV